MAPERSALKRWVAIRSDLGFIVSAVKNPADYDGVVSAGILCP